MLAPVVLLCFLCSLRRDLRMPLVQAAEGDGEQTRRLEVGGEALPLDELGPIIINEDGTMRRIANWHLLTDSEREATQRRISTRNKARIDVLKQRAEEEEMLGQEVDVKHSNEKEEPLLLPESVQEPPPSPVHGGDGSDESTWPPPDPSETSEGEHFPPRSMF